MKTEINQMGESVHWQDLTEGCAVVGSGTARAFNTEDWRVDTPLFIEEKCKQCLLCVPVCPDSAIPVSNKECGVFDLEHCKGCGICVKACSFEAIVMEGGKA
ncbi:4Fe-4S binding protein [Eubacterium aggregans]|uniref:4Fe-4S binding protein n=1 Tax=Eubacterium aggregans TaxID=81409 RepID=UPI003F340C42